jgi:hypothetical protein
MSTFFAQRVEDKLDIRLIWMSFEKLNSCLASSEHGGYEYYSEVYLVYVLLSRQALLNAHLVDRWIHKVSSHFESTEFFTFLAMFFHYFLMLHVEVCSGMPDEENFLIL